jgi:hypothetical protein
MTHRYLTYDRKLNSAWKVTTETEPVRIVIWQPGGIIEVPTDTAPMLARLFEALDLGWAVELTPDEVALRDRAAMQPWPSEYDL